ncbi:DUF6263 family protein [Marinifilum sp.]|uniref:DUF6263 family protein n=1 Tax=Marinifilum sp. TaxID=2033137 RepID=UPI003BAA1AD1
MKKLLTIALILTVTFCVQAKKYKLALHLEKGKEYTQKTTANMTIKQDINGMSVEIKMMIKGDILYTVKSNDNSQYTMDVVYENMMMDMDTPQGKTSFSSNNVKEGDIMSTMLSRITNKPFVLKMSNTGKVISVNGLEKIFEGMFEGFDFNTQQKEQIVAQLRQSYGKKAFKGSFEQITNIYPEEMVKIGSQWMTETNIEAGMSVKLRTNFELKEASDNYYLIHGVGDMASDPDAAFMKQNNMDMKIELNGQLISDIKIDKTSGWIIEATISQDLSGTTHIKGNAQMPDGMKIPMSLKSKSIITK